MPWTDPRDWTAGETVTEAIMDTHIRDDLAWLYDNLPIRASMFHGLSLVENGNAITSAISTNQFYNQAWLQSAAANGDIFTNSFVLGEGTYTMHILGQTTGNSAKIDWVIDGTTILTGQDWYSAGFTFNVEKTIAAITVAANDGGRHVLTGTVNGRNGASGDFQIRLTKIWFEPASDS